MTAERGPALSVDGLGKRFGDRVAFEGVSFEIAYGEVFGFLGPNGAGKTTTVRTLGTLIAPSSGSATVAGLPLTPDNGVEIRRRIAIMPESPGLYQRLSVAENLECFADLYEVPEPAVQIEQALRAVNLTERAGDPCGALSKGLRQRVALARALLSQPEILFLDEPTSGLDPVASRDVHELIAQLGRSGVTIFLTTHRLEEAERLCHRVAILNTRLQTIGRPAELRDRLFAHAGVASALIHGSDVIAQVAFTPLLAAWSIWIGIAISTRVNDVRVAQQLSVLASLPTIAVTTLIAFDVIHPTLKLALGLGVALLVLNRVGWRFVSALFDRERLIIGTK